MESRLEVLERQVRLMKRCATLVAALLVGLIAMGFRPQPGTAEVLRVRGLIIVDSAGRERILIGAPIPVAAGRLRNDPRRVDSAWSGRYPRGVYMRAFAQLRHSVVGVLVLDEHGVDRLAIGDSVPDPNIGRRIGTEVGLVMNDANGFERTGYGVFDARQGNRVSLGLDTRRGDAVALVAADSGPAGVLINHMGARTFLGVLPAASQFSGISGPFAGLSVRGTAGTKEVRGDLP